MKIYKTITVFIPMDNKTTRESQEALVFTVRQQINKLIKKTCGTTQYKKERVCYVTGTNKSNRIRHD